MRTHRSEVHEAGEGDDPEVLGVDYVATASGKILPTTRVYPSLSESTRLYG